MAWSVVTKTEIANRNYWVDEISRLSGNFGVDSSRVESEIADEIEEKGIASLLGHLRLCGAIPERYGHDSSEEKLYSNPYKSNISASCNEIGFCLYVYASCFTREICQTNGEI